MQTLIIKELTFEAAHYLPGHPKCRVIHGHMYYVRNLDIEFSKFVDFGSVKATIQSFDHVLIAPIDHLTFWNKSRENLERLGIALAMKYTVGHPTVENISLVLRDELMRIDGVEKVSFELYEGPNQGVRIC